MSGVITDQNPLFRVKPELILQTLGKVDVPDEEIKKTMFKKSKNVYSDTIAASEVQRVVKAVPYVADGADGVPLGDPSESMVAHTVPPMKAHHRVKAKTLKRIKHLKGTDFRAWLQEEMQWVKTTIKTNTEWLLRSMLTTGSLDYKYLLGPNEWHSHSLDFGAMTAVAAVPATLFSDPTCTVTNVAKHLRDMFKAGRDIKNRGFFRQPSKVITYARWDVWEFILEMMEQRRGDNTVTGKQINETDLRIGPWLVRAFDAEIVDPEDQTESNAIPDKRMRMIDLSQNNTIVNLEIDNIKATGGQSHVLVQNTVDPKGRFVDIDVEWRPLPLCVAGAIVDSLAVIA